MKAEVRHTGGGLDLAGGRQHRVRPHTTRDHRHGWRLASWAGVIGMGIVSVGNVFPTDPTNGDTPHDPR